MWASFRHQQSLPRCTRATGLDLAGHSVSSARCPLPLGRERGYTGKHVLGAAGEVWWAAVLSTVGSRETIQPLDPVVLAQWAHSATLYCLWCQVKETISFESQISSLLCSRTVHASRWIARAWHLLVTEPSVKCDLQLIGITLYYGKNARIAKLHDWDVSSCQPDLTALALTYVMHYRLLTTLHWVQS